MKNLITKPKANSQLVSINPANNSIVGSVPISSPDEIIEKVHLAHSAKRNWKEMGSEKRIAILRNLLIKFQERQNEIGALVTQEMGKTSSEVNDDFDWDFAYFHDFLSEGGRYIEDEITIRKNKAFHRIVYEPRGVVACIVPWNFPFANFVWGVIPNLIVGNTVIFKHSELCPLVGKIIEEIMLSSPELPRGVFSEIYGGAQEGEFLIEQDVDMVWFTGSSAVGKKIFERAGKKQIKAVLEMGGSNPALVFPDVDLDSIIPKIYRGRFTNCGQVCDAIKRVIIHRSLYEQFVQKITKYIHSVKIGDPADSNTQLGPLASEDQAILLEEQVNDAIAKGAKAIIGGSRSKISGAYYLPTILVNINREMRVWNEEVFGPVLPIISFETEEEAITLANDTIYGLGAVIYSKDIEVAERVAAQLEVGFVDINDGNHWQQCNPFGGYKASGVGCEHGRLGFQELCQFKVIARE